MPKLEKIDFWVWQDPATQKWAYRSARIPWHTGTDAYAMGLNCKTPDAAKNGARYEIRQYGYGAKLVPVPQDFSVGTEVSK